MVCPGLVSITFRNLLPTEIVALVTKTGLKGIEWGGDVHVPHGDLEQARKVRKMTEDAGLLVAAYGSYYVVGREKPVSFGTVLETAVALNAPTIRVWAGYKGSAAADNRYFDGIVRETQRIADLAEIAGVTISYEFHSGTLTDNHIYAARLLKEVAHNNVRTYWQPPGGIQKNTVFEGLETMLPWLSNIHVFHWKLEKRYLLADGAALWTTYLQAIASTNRDHFAMIEFVKDNIPENFLRDAVMLNNWLSSVNSTIPVQEINDPAADRGEFSS